MRISCFAVLLLIGPAASSQERTPDVQAEREAGYALADTAWSGAFEAEAPVRTLTERAGLLPGVRRSERTDTLFVRGVPLRSAFFGGHPTTLSATLPRTAVGAVQAYVGDVPARYGDVYGSALVAEPLRPGLEGAAFLGEAFQNGWGGGAAGGLASASVPVVRGRLALRVDAEGQAVSDRAQYGLVGLTPEAEARLEASASVLRVPVAGGFVDIPLTADIPSGTPLADVAADPAAYGLEPPASLDGADIAGADVVSTARLLGEDDFERRDRLGARREGQVYGALRARPSSALTLDVGAQWGRSTADRVEPYFALLSPDLLPQRRQETRRLLGTAELEVGTATVVADVSATDEARTDSPAGFSADLRDALRYDTRRGEPSPTFYRIRNESGDYVIVQAIEETIPREGPYGLARAAGFGSTLYDRLQAQAMRAALRAEVRPERFGLERLEVGTEWKTATHRRYRLDAAGLPSEAERAGAETYEALAPRSVSPTVYFGYDRLGLEEASVSDSAGSAYGSAWRRAPYRPRYAAAHGEAEGKWAFGEPGGRQDALRVRVGIRVVRAAADNVEPVFSLVEGEFVDPVYAFSGTRGVEAEWAVLPRVRTDFVLGPLGFFAYHGAFARQPDPVLYRPAAALYESYFASREDPSEQYRLRLLERASESGLGASWSSRVGAGDLALRATLYQRQMADVRPLRSRFVGVVDVWRGVPIDEEAERVTGVEMQAGFASGRRFVRAAYTFAAGPDRALQPAGLYGITGRALQRSPSDGDLYLPDVRPHQAEVQLGWSSDPDSRTWVGRLGLTVAGRYASGRLYQATEYPRFLLDAFPANIASMGRTPGVYEADLQATYAWQVGPVRLSAFALVENALGRRTPVRVYAATGRPDEDGFLATGDGQAFQERGGSAGLYRAALGDPSHYARGRSFRFGIRVAR